MIRIESGLSADDVLSVADLPSGVTAAYANGVLTLKVGQRDDLSDAQLKNLLEGTIDVIRRRLFEVVIQMGAILAIIAAYARRLWGIAGDVVRGVVTRDAFGERGRRRLDGDVRGHGEFLIGQFRHACPSPSRRCTTCAPAP